MSTNECGNERFDYDHVRLCVKCIEAETDQVCQHNLRMGIVRPSAVDVFQAGAWNESEEWMSYVGDVIRECVPGETDTLSDLEPLLNDTSVAFHVRYPKALGAYMEHLMNQACVMAFFAGMYEATCDRIYTDYQCAVDLKMGLEDEVELLRNRLNHGRSIDGDECVCGEPACEYQQ